MTARSCNNVAWNLIRPGKYAEAEPLHRAAVAIRQKVLGEEHPDTAISYDNLALEPDRPGQIRRGRGPLRKALTIHADGAGRGHTPLRHRL